jgi:hypothetical protein
MPRPKGSQNKITSEVKEKLQLLIDDLIDSLNIKELDANQRIKMLQIALQYTLPRMKQATNEVSEDLPLFVWFKSFVYPNISISLIKKQSDLKKLILLTLIFTLSSCYTTQIVVGEGAKGNQTIRLKQTHLINGLVSFEIPRYSRKIVSFSKTIPKLYCF